MDSIDDVEEMQIMDEAFDILGFKLEEKVLVFCATTTGSMVSPRAIKPVLQYLYPPFTDICTDGVYMT